MALQVSPSSAVPGGEPSVVHLSEVRVGNLPAEIWLQTFAQGKRLDDADLLASTTPGAHHADSVTAISQTCSYFRRLAVSTPALWTSIRVDNTAAMSNILLRIGRSYPLPLDIAISALHETNGAASISTTDLGSFLDIVMQVIERLRSLRIRVGLEQTEHPIVMRLHNQQAPLLEYLSLSVNAKEPGVLPLLPPHIFNYGAPKLASVKLRGVAHTFYRPPLSRLTTLRLEGNGHLSMGFDSFVDIITQPSHLRHLLIRRDVVPAEAWATQGRRTLRISHLETLHIYSESGSMYSGFLLAMDAPKLSALTLEGVFDPDLDPLCAAASTETFSSLASISLLSEEDLSTTTYVNICRLFPNISTYTARHISPSSSQLVKVLSKPPSNNGAPVLLWPKLRTLQLASAPLANAMDWIRELVGIRANVLCPLARICFFESDKSAWMKEDELSSRLGTVVQLTRYTEVLSGEVDYIDVDDVAL